MNEVRDVRVGPTTDLRDALARWDEIKPILTPRVVEAIIEFREIAKTVVRYIRQFGLHFRRIQLSARLCRWMPGSVAWWLARRCPERWLPRLDMRGLTDAISMEETE